MQFAMDGNSSVIEVNQLAHAFEDMRRELARSIEREWQLEQERSTMLAALAHDLRTPLTIIQGHAENLERMIGEEHEEKRNRYVQVIKRNTSRATNLLQDMNAITEMEQVSFRLNPVALDIGEFMDEKKPNTSPYAIIRASHSERNSRMNGPPRFPSSSIPVGSSKCWTI